MGIQCAVETGHPVHRVPALSPSLTVAWHPSKYVIAYCGLSRDQVRENAPVISQAYVSVFGPGLSWFFNLGAQVWVCWNPWFIHIHIHPYPSIHPSISIIEWKGAWERTWFATQAKRAPIPREALEASERSEAVQFLLILSPLPLLFSTVLTRSFVYPLAFNGSRYNWEFKFYAGQNLFLKLYMSPHCFTELM